MLWPNRGERIARTADSWTSRSARGLTTEERRERDQWRAADPAHEAAWMNAQSLMTVTDGMRRPTKATAPAMRAPWRPAFALAGLVAVIAAAGGAFLLETRQGNGSMSTAQFATAAKPTHGRLADGTRVDLDPDSSIRADFRGPVRAVLLEYGTARFDVAHDAAHPFVVSAGDRKVTAIGTRFEVALHPRGVTVTLFQGAIEVAAKAKAPAQPPVRMMRGQRLTVDDGRETLSVVPPADLSTSGPRDVTSTPAAAIVAEANRTATTPIRFADQALGERALQGRFDTRDTAALAAQLGVALDLVVSKANGGYLLSNH